MPPAAALVPLSLHAVGCRPHAHARAHTRFDDEIAVLCDVLSGTQTRPGFESSLSSLRKHTPRHTRHAVPSHPAPVRQMVCGHVHVREVCIPHPLALGDETETTKPVPSHLVLARVFSSPAPATCPAPISFSTLLVTW